MTPQEIFNFSVRHMRQQGVKATANNDCVYLTDQGLSCAVGCFIADDPDLCHDLDTSIFESSAIDDVIGAFEDRLPSWMPSNLKLLENLQTLHDIYLGTDRFEERVAYFAEKHGLEIPT